MEEGILSQPARHSFISNAVYVVYGRFILCLFTAAADSRRIDMALFADDLTLWKTGTDIQQMANEITALINDYIDPWATSHNKQPNATALSFPNTIVTLNHSYVSMTKSFLTVPMMMIQGCVFLVYTLTLE